MEPFSASVNVIALLEAAGLSARLLYRLFRNFHDAPAEVERYCRLLEALTQTFSALEAFQSDDNNALHLADNFAQRLAACVADLREIHARVQQSSSVKTKNAILKSWKRLKWATSSDEWLEKFFDRLNIYHVDFALAIASAQL
jgi:hypothetical protein